MRQSLESIVRLELSTASSDQSGLLTVLEAVQHLPQAFVIRRTFWVHGVAAGTCRGRHAHKRCSQGLVAMTGVVDVAVSDGRSSREFRLDRSGELLLIPPLVWSTQTYITDGAILCVFCDEEYKEEEYIRDFDEYLSAVEA